MSGLPNGWVEVALGQVATSQLGRMLSSSREKGDHPKPYLRNRDVQWGHINIYELPVMDFGPSDAVRFLLRPGDVLVCEGGEVGRAAIWHGQLDECYYQKALHRIRTSNALLPGFLLYLLEYYARTRAFERYSSGSTIAHLPQEDLRNLPIPIPPPAEQKRIVAAIEEQFSRLDAGIAALNKAQQNIKCFRAAILRAAVTGSLLSENSSSSTTADASLDRPISASFSVDNASRINRTTKALMARTWEVPSTWTWKAAAEVCEVIASGSTPPQTAMRPDHGDIPYIKVYNLTHRGYLDFTIRPTFIDREIHEGRLRRSRLYPGDILTNIVGPPLGKVAVVPSDHPEWNTNQAVVVFRPIESLNPILLKYWLLSDPVRALLESTSKATAGQFNVSLTTCRAVPLPIPPRSDQDRIVKAVEEKLSTIEAQEAIIERLIMRAGSLRSAILSASFRGALVPQDPTDDPAAVLVERSVADGTSLNGRRSSRNRKRQMQQNGGAS